MLVFFVPIQYTHDNKHVDTFGTEMSEYHI